MFCELHHENGIRKIAPEEIVSKVMTMGFPLSETVVQRCSVKNVFLKIS